MRLIGVAERALELMRERAKSRVAFGQPLAEQGVVRQWIAEARLAIDPVAVGTFLGLRARPAANAARNAPDPRCGPRSPAPAGRQ